MTKTEEVKVLRAQVKDQTKLIALYQGEGDHELREEAEYRLLACKSRRTAEETKRVRQLAKLLGGLSNHASLSAVQRQLKALRAAQRVVPKGSPVAVVIKRALKGDDE